MRFERGAVERAGAVTPAAIRPALAQAAANRLGAITGVADGRRDEHHEACVDDAGLPECGAQFRQEVHVPDHKASTNG
jgi:hypothetical protein